MSPRQALILDLVLLLGLAVMWNRATLPAWAKIETYQQRPAVIPTFQWGPISVVPAAFGQRISLTGSDLLFVGDSMLADSPWEGDVICIPGATTPDLEKIFAKQVAGRRYERILLWWGTYHLAGRHGIDSYVEATVRMARLAQAHADQIVVIGAMPYDPTQLERLIEFRPHEHLRERLEPDTRELVREATARLRDALPDVPIYDAAAFRAGVTAAYAEGELFADGMHLTEQGFARLGAELRGLGYLPERAHARGGGAAGHGAL